MTLQEAVKSGKRFKRRGWDKWYTELVDYDTTTGNCLALRSGLDFTFLRREDILATDWEVKEEWYEGDFKKKYPNGVLCWVWDRGFIKRMAIVIGYDKERVHPFLVTHGAYYEYAEPVKPEEAPAIVGE